MSDPLVVSGGGRITVASEELVVAAARCRTLAGRLEAVAGSLASVPALLGLAAEVDDVAARLRTAGLVLTIALDAYSLAESALARVAREAVEQAGYWAGFLGPVILALAPPAALLAAASFAAGGAAAVRADPRVLSDPSLVAGIRLLAGGADDAMRGAARMPWALSQLADDDATGIGGREAAAGVLLHALALAGGAAPAGLRLTTSVPAPTRAPRTLAELADRIPPSGGPQVRIERYPGAERDVVAVYLAGTADFGLAAGSEPWDLRSDVAGMSATLADSVAATSAAMRAAEVGPEDAVVLVGYSQGGLIASRVAESGDYRVGGIVTLGSPGGAVPVPDGVPVLAVEHAEDLVPALAGPAVGAASRVTVTRSLYDGVPPDSARAVPAHQLAEYRSTLALADRSEEARVARVRAAVLGRFPWETGSAVEVRAERAG